MCLHKLKTKKKTATYTTVNEDGILNNYATQPKMYYGEYPAIWEQRKYVVQAVFASLIVTTLVLVALSVS
ncbi:MAG: ssl1498 family light-harvesting-like protein [Scytonema hyalinum WJT4-NPBG1]|nr:ssl1498 family light-harvesting-like protein [Scytonema hyalinum WJT4-NPBG1]